MCTRPKTQTESARGARETARARCRQPRARSSHEAEAAEADAREPLEDAEREVQRLSAEAKALGDLLHPEGEGLFPPLVDAVTVQSGYEAALAAALGDDLQAPLDEASPHHWRDLGAFDCDAAAAGRAPSRSSDFVKAPAALARRLAMTGVVFPDQGAALQKQLQARPAAGLGARRSVALGRLMSPRADAPVACRRAPVAAQSPRRAGKRNRDGAKQMRADALRRLFRRQGQPPTPRARRRAPPKQDERARRTGADRRAGPRHPRRPRRRRTRLAACRRWKRKSAASPSRVDAAEESAPPGRSGARGTGRRRRAQPQDVAEARGQTADARTACRRSARRAGKPAPRRRSPASAASPPSPTNARAGKRARPTPRRQIAELTRRQRGIGRRTGQPPKPCPNRSPTSAVALLDAIAAAETARNEAADARAASRDRVWPKPTSTPRPPMRRCPPRARNAPAPRRCRKPPPARIDELRDPHPRRTRMRAGRTGRTRRDQGRRGTAAAGTGREARRAAEAGTRAAWRRQSARRGRSGRTGSAPDHPGRRPRRPGRRHRPPAPRHPEPEPRRPRAAARLVREGERATSRSCSPSCSKAAKPSSPSPNPKTRWKPGWKSSPVRRASGCSRWRCCRAASRR